MTMLKRLGRLFVIKSRTEAWLVTYAIAVGAIERGQHYMHQYPGFRRAGSWRFAHRRCLYRRSPAARQRQDAGAADTRVLFAAHSAGDDAPRARSGRATRRWTAARRRRTGRSDGLNPNLSEPQKKMRGA